MNFSRKVPKHKEIAVSSKLETLLNKINATPGTLFVTFINELEMIVLGTLERATRLCPKKLAFNHYEANPAKNLLVFSGLP